MARMLGNEPDKVPAAAAKVRSLIIGGVRFNHTAAQFWSSLLSEVAGDFPECTALIFETMNGAVLTRELLFPEMALQRELNNLPRTFRLEQALKEALAEFDLYGPPGAVQLCLKAPARPPATLSHSDCGQAMLSNGDVVGGDDREIMRCELPLDCVDTDIFVYLLVWLLEWAELPEDQWNDELLEGAFALRDLDGTLNGRLQFEFRRKHIQEGLYHWRLLIRGVPTTLCAHPQSRRGG